MSPVDGDGAAGPDGRPAVAKSATAFRTISEVAGELDLPQHVLRFWETKFSQVRPMKRAGGRRYYRPEDVALLHRIRSLLYDDGYTIKGVQKLLREKGGARGLLEDAATEAPAADTAIAMAGEAPPADAPRVDRAELEAVLGELQAIRRLLDADRA